MSTCIWCFAGYSGKNKTHKVDKTLNNTMYYTVCIESQTGDKKVILETK